MKDKIFRLLLFVAALLVLVLSAAIVYALVSRSSEAFQEYGIRGFIANAEWDPRSATEEYGALSFIVGTLYTAFFALMLCIPFALSVALFNGVYFKGKKYPMWYGRLSTCLQVSLPSYMAFGVFTRYAR